MLDRDRLLRTFLAVARTGSLRAASSALGITQPAVSKQVSALESFLGVPLFERHGRGMRPTPHGQRLLDEATHAFELVDSALDSARGGTARASGHVSISTVNTLAAYLIPEVVASVRETYPHLTLSVLNASSPDVVERVERGLSDIGLVYDLAVDTDSVVLRRLSHESVAAYCRQSADVPEFLTPRELAERPLILPPRPYALRRVVERSLPSPPHIVVECNSVSLSLDLAMKGVGIAILPSHLPSTAVEGRNLRQVGVVGLDLGRQVALIHRKITGQLPLSVERTLRIIEACAKRL